MRRVGDIWLVSTANLREMCKVSEEHGADEGMLFVSMQAEVCDDPSPEAGVDGDDGGLEWPKRPQSSPPG